MIAATEVLIVDDSLTVRMDLKDAFTAAGFVVTVSASVAGARAALAGHRFALVLLDVLLPDGDGLALLQEIKGQAATRNLPVLVLSTEAEVRDRVRALHTGADEYIGKPYDLGYVLARARELVLGQGASASGEAPPCVLLIDDSPTVCEVLAAALRADGYLVVTATSGEDGLRIAAAERPAALIVDGSLPGGIDGTTVVRRLKLDAALRHIPCLLLTGSEDPDDELRALEAGADAFLRKSSDTDEVRLRLAAMLRSATPASAPVLVSLSGPKRILAVDDSPTYLHRLGDELRKEGYEVVLAASGREALELLAVQSVDCIVLDLIMPDLSGQETCRQIKRDPRWRDIPLVVLTALEERGAMIEGLAAGADDYITKSGEFEVLKARLRAQLRRRQVEEESRLAREELVRAAADKQLRSYAAALEVANRALEAAKERAEAESRFKSRFLANMSHELRTPLNAIIGFSELLQQSYAGNLSGRQNEYVGYVLHSGHHLLELINEILDISKVEAGHLELRRQTVSIRAMVESVQGVIRPLAESRQIALEVDLPPDLPELWVDPMRIKQVLYNLLSNGLKFTPLGGRVGLSAHRDGPCVVVRVEDSGVGIRTEDLPRLFREFERLAPISGEQPEGTGLGLALSKRLVELHGGSISAHSEVGRGSVFQVKLPINAAEPVAITPVVELTKAGS